MSLQEREPPGEEIAASLTGVRVLPNIAGRNVTTFSIGGPLPFFTEVSSEASLSELLVALRIQGRPYRVIGGGSNLLIADDGITECVIRLGKEFRYVKRFASEGGEERFVCGGAVSLMNLSRELSRDGFSGLEFGGGIPAWLGGAVRMNAGAHGAEFVSVLKRIVFLDSEGRRHEVTPSELSFGYRVSGLPEGAVVTEVTIGVVPSDAQVTEASRSRYLAERKARQPLQFPSAGSVFRNPLPLTAGAVLEECGMKGVRVGGASVSELHGNWIINDSRTARSIDVQELIAVCQRVVQEKRGISLQPEVVIWR